MYKSYSKQKAHVTIGNKADIYDVLLSNEASTVLFPRILQNVVNYTRSSVIFFRSGRDAKGNRRVAFRLCFKARPGAKLFIWKVVLFTRKWSFDLRVGKKFHMEGFVLRFALEQAKDNTEIAY